MGIVRCFGGDAARRCDHGVRRNKADALYAFRKPGGGAPALIEQYRSDEMQESLRYVFRVMNGDLAHEDFYGSCGALVCARVVDLELLLRYFPRAATVRSVAADLIALQRTSPGGVPARHRAFDAT